MKEIKEEDSIKKEKLSINWALVLFYLYLHILGIIGIYFLFTKAKWITVFYFLFLVTISSIALTAGAHRLYAHSSFVATAQLKLFIMLAHTLAGVNKRFFYIMTIMTLLSILFFICIFFAYKGPIQDWVFWHRIHHTYYGTDKDPYNHSKGFLYSHFIGNLLSASSDREEYIKDIDMRDVEVDGYVWTQQKFYWILFIVFGFLLPINAPVQYWDEPWINSILIIGATRLMITTNISWLVNSALLIWGLERGAKYPVDDNSVFFLSKSYWLNYHYQVPWDWKCDEFGTYEKGFNTFMIKMWRELGLVNEMKTTTSNDVRDALCKIATSEMTLKEALDELKRTAQETAYREKLMFHH